MIDIARPKIEGSIAVADGDRRIGFAEYGSATGRAIVWLHGTPGARRQIPVEARAYALERGIRLIGLDRPGVGSSSPHRYDNVAAFAPDLAEVLEALGIDDFAIIGLSGGGPYALGVAHAMPDRVTAAGILGGVAPTVGPDRIEGGATLSTWPIGEPAISIYGRLSPQADRELLARPEFRAMFLDDLLHGGSRRMNAPFADVVVFARDWGFRVGDVTVPVRWWHGDADHIIPYAHGEHMVSLLPDAKLFEMPGESHLSTLHMATDIIDELLALWDQSRPPLGE